MVAAAVACLAAAGCSAVKSMAAGVPADDWHLTCPGREAVLRGNAAVFFGIGQVSAPGE